MDSDNKEWKPDEKLLESLVNMGISRKSAEVALYYTGNSSADAAATFHFDNPDIETISPSIVDNAAQVDKHLKIGDDESSEEDFDHCKMVFVVNTSLGMGVGKVAAQVAHATLGLYRNLIEDERVAEHLGSWQEYGEKKIVLKGTDAEHLQNLQKTAREKNVHSYLVQDAGHTQIPAGSVTVLGLFGEENLVNSVSGKLGLM